MLVVIVAPVQRVSVGVNNVELIMCEQDLEPELNDLRCVCHDNVIPWPV